MKRTYVKQIPYADMLTDAQAAVKKAINNIAPILAYEMSNTVINGKVDVSITAMLSEFDPMEIYHVDEAIIKNKDTASRLPVYVANINDAKVIFVYKSTEDVIHDVRIKIIGKNTSGEYNAVAIDTPYNHYIFTKDVSSYAIYKEDVKDIKVVDKKYENESFIKSSLSLFLPTQNLKIVNGSPSKIDTSAITRIDYKDLLNEESFKYLITAPKYRDSGKCYILPIAAYYSKADLERIVMILLHDELCQI